MKMFCTLKWHAFDQLSFVSDSHTRDAEKAHCDGPMGESRLKTELCFDLFSIGILTLLRHYNSH